MYIGKINGKYCFTRLDSANESALITGCSGTGKTTKMQEIELMGAKSGNTVIVFDTGCTHSRDNIFTGFRAEYNSYENRIDAEQDGLNLCLWNDRNMKEVISVLGTYYRLGYRQKGVLRRAVSGAGRYIERGYGELEALQISLKALCCNDSEILLEKMWNFLESGVVRNSNKQIKKDRINIIDLSGLGEDTKQVIMEILLAVCWSYIQNEKEKEEKLVLSLDEFQDLSMGKNAIILRMLREGRKFHSSFLLATQTLSTFSKEAVSVINQAATRVYFRPPVNELEKTAREIEPGNHLKWKKKLSGLKVGHCIVVGDVAVGNVAISRPLIL